MPPAKLFDNHRQIVPVGLQKEWIREKVWLGVQTAIRETNAKETVTKKEKLSYKQRKEL